MAENSGGVRADFFVHPDYDRIYRGDREVSTEYEYYEDMLHERIDASKLPILLHDNRDEARSGEFWNRFPAEHRFATRRGSGYMDLWSHEPRRLNELLEAEVVVGGLIHGSYGLACLDDFKLSLRATDGEFLQVREEIGQAHRTNITDPTILQFGVVLMYDTRAQAYVHNYIPSDMPHLDASIPLEQYAPDAKVFYSS